MLSSDDTTQTTGAIEKISRPYNHRENVSERRQQILHQKQTEDLPRISSQETQGRIVWRQYMQLREENKRLRSEIARYVNEIDAIQNAHQQDIALYESHLDTITAQLNSTIQDHLDLERRYQKLYHSFQSAVEEEAHNMLAEATRTLELHSENRLTTDALKTVELHVKQIEEQHTAETLYLVRQAQKKAYQLEHELAQERQQMTAERESIQNQQNSWREQAGLHIRMVEEQLHAKFIATITFIATILVLLLVISQLLFLSWLHVPLAVALLVPGFLFALIAGFLAHIRSTARSLFSIAPPKSADQKTS
jgi:hypothetical protein